jgi:Cu(I)/Ag(I) efflux system membrane fusion protein
MSNTRRLVPLPLPDDDPDATVPNAPIVAAAVDAARQQADAAPFGVPRTSRRARLTIALGMTTALAGAGAVTWVATRGRSTPTPAASAAPAHDHGAAAAGDVSQPVMLSPDQARRIGVTYVEATLAPLSTEVRTVAQVTYDETRVKAISPKLEGWVEQLYVNYTGQPIRAGEPLLAIYSPTIVAAQQELLLAAQLEKDVGSGTSDARAGATDLRAAARRRLLYWDISASDVDRLERTGEVTKTVVLRAPVSGVVLEKNVLAGQRIMAGDALYKVADLSVVWVEGEVFERDLASVHVGQRVQAEFQALPGETRSGRINYIYPTISPDTRTARVRVEMPNRDLALKPGMYATIRINGEHGDIMLTVPRSAVLSTGKRDVVFVRRADGMLEAREVQIGVANDARMQILRGLSAGETVVASATFLVDAESNLGSLLGGMGNMPGMDIAPPAAPPAHSSQPPR